ncbi:replication protein RepA [Hyphomicrobium sp. B1]|uniref:replication protein RepA n=1 Tax=Hyphomicrobium sp. B1 TaxID=3075651 RepID=UPI003C2F2C4B
MTFGLDTLPQVRDADLVQRVAEATPFLRDSIISSCVREQERRDKLSAMPPGQRRRVATQRQIAEESGIQRQDLRHIHSVLAICSLPYTAQPLAVREWQRRQGRMSLMVSAGKLVGRDGEWVDQPLPYGSRARLLLLHTCSEALRQKSATIQIEDTLTGFIKSMGFAVTGGKNGTLNSFKQQINALAACNMKIGVWDGERAKTVSTQPFSSIDVWFPTQPEQKMLWPSTVTFSQDFYQTLTKHALPVNIHAVKAFSSSPRKLDMLFWLGYRLNNLDKPLNVSWEALREQWGTGYSRSTNFRRDFAQEIDQIKEVFPKLPVKVTELGVTISPGAGEVLALPTKGRKT